MKSVRVEGQEISKPVRIVLRIMLSAILGLWITGESLAAPELSDADASRILGKRFAIPSFGVQQIKIGRIAIVTSQVEYGYRDWMDISDHRAWLRTGRLPGHVMPIYQAWANAGLITMQQQHVSSLLEQALIGAETFVVTVTERGQKARLGGFLKDGVGLHQVRMGQWTVDRIVKNDGMAGGGEEFRLVLGVLAGQLTAVGKELNQHLPTLVRAPEKARFRALLKHDPFKSEWMVFAYDFAAEEEREWRSSSVESHIREKGLR